MRLCEGLQYIEGVEGREVDCLDSVFGGVEGITSNEPWCLVMF
jgi:hypothetical protein